jgi:hypothetical protein
MANIIKIKALVALLASGVIFATASPALANTTPVPVPGTQVANASPYMDDLAVKQVKFNGKLIVYDEQIKVDHQSTQGAQWFAVCTNSSYVAGSYHGNHIVGYPDHHCLLQRDSHSPTGWVKRGGGKSGRDCKNIAAPPHVKVPFPVFHGPLVSFSSRAQVTITVHARAHISSTLTLWCGSVSGSATAEDNVQVSYMTYAKLKGAAKMNFFAQFFVAAADSVSGKLHLDCSYTPPPVPTPSSTPTPTPTPTPTVTPPKNHPPHGILYVPVHRYVGSNDKGACVDEVSDLDGDPIKFTFKYVDAFGREVGTMVGGANAVWQQPGGAWCDTWIAPADPTQVTVYVTLDDGHGGVVTYSDNFPVIANQTGN